HWERVFNGGEGLSQDARAPSAPLCGRREGGPLNWPPSAHAVAGGAATSTPAPSLRERVPYLLSHNWTANICHLHKTITKLSGKSLPARPWLTRRIRLLPTLSVLPDSCRL